MLIVEEGVFELETPEGLALGEIERETEIEGVKEIVGEALGEGTVSPFIQIENQVGTESVPALFLIPAQASVDQ